MSASSFRLNDKSEARKVTFTFNRQCYQGREGESLAAALLANGIFLVGRSFKYHRPRGILSHGMEEPQALVQLEPDTPHTEANRRATEVELYEGLVAESQNCWPSVSRDIGAVAQWFSPLLSAGFYYKTFKRPQVLWPLYERYIRKAAGMGHSPTDPDPDTYQRRYGHFDIVIIGGGLAGLAAAVTAADSGLSVLIAEQRAYWGGELNTEARENGMVQINDQAPQDWVNQTVTALEQAENVTVLPRTTVFAHYCDRYLGLLERLTDHQIPGQRQGDRQRLWQVRTRAVIHAAGQIERPLLFPYNDRPGIMLAQSVRHYINHYHVVPGKQAVVLTNNDQAYQTALTLHHNGASVPAIVDIRETPGEYWRKQAEQAGITIMPAASIKETAGNKHINQITIKTASGEQRIGCDLLAISGGFNPTIHLWSHAEGQVVYDDKLGTYVPGTPEQPNQFACGGIRGTDSYTEAGRQAIDAAVGALQQCGSDKTEPPQLQIEEPAFSEPCLHWCLTDEQDIKKARKTFVDTATDATMNDVRQAIAEGFENVEHVKRYTTAGMGPDQGKTVNVNLFHLVARLRGINQAEVGTTTFRPPYTPVTFSAIAGYDSGTSAIMPNRYTPMDDWHRRNHAVYENVGNWWRARYYKITPDETLREAVSRESWAARNTAGILDGTTLGKIDIQGPDAAEFLNRVYTNRWDTLKVGRCRYGVMVGEDGMVMDDGVTARISDNHYHMTTTTGGAPKVMAWLERWLQTEWPDLRVYLTSVTEQWGVLSTSGPNAQQIVNEFLTELNCDIDASDIQPLDLKTGTFAMNDHHNLPIRIFGIAFSGEDGYEINVPARYAAQLWARFNELGEPRGLVPYGTETMHLLRAEKGFIIVGQETDGTINPFDLGMSWAVSHKKGDFIGKRSLYREDMKRADRKQLVGLLPDDTHHVLEEGANLIATPQVPEPPVPIMGHVTASYYSPNLQRSFALALLKQGLDYPGDKVYVADPLGGDTVPVQIVDKQFL